ncbi:MAG: type I phosphomannose isomerase catalytic subunit, partial [Paracoccaceae bacterium]
MRLILGSGSPRRLELLAGIGVVPDEIRVPDIDEDPRRKELPRGTMPAERRRGLVNKTHQTQCNENKSSRVFQGVCAFQGLPDKNQRAARLIPRCQKNLVLEIEPMQNLYPFRFQSLLRRYIWGGRRLETVLGKRLPAGDDYAESWEVVDHGDDQSVVAHGPLAGTTLSTLLKLHGKALLGQHYPQESFPLLFKFLDAQRR